MNLVEITTKTYDVELNIAYATKNNFTGAQVYSNDKCFLHKDAEVCLRRSIEYAATLGYKLKIYDAYRSTEAQELLWSHTPDPEFLADPKVGSPHSRGVAVDLTLIDNNNNPLNMGTEFDSFTNRSHHGCLAIPVSAQRNRYILLGIMTTGGWDFYRNEWWHYQLFNSKSYPLISGKTLLPDNPINRES